MPRQNQPTKGSIMIDYKATGTLIGSMITVNRNDVSIILVSKGDQYVVSRYRNGENEWFSGRYFTDNGSALTEFNRQCQEWCVS